MSLGSYRPPPSRSETPSGAPPVPAALIGLLLVLAVALAMIFLVAAQNVHTL